MRETRLSGSKREDWAAIGPSSSLLYWSIFRAIANKNGT